MLRVLEMPLAGLKLITPKVFSDERGFFFESYRQSDYAACGVDVSFVQDNVAFSKKGVLRALHYQESPGQAKLVSCIQGRIWDVAVDIRPASPTFGKWIAVELDDQTHQQLFIPVGFAHGYCTLTDTARVSYKVSSPYNPKAEKSIRWNDPQIAISWPIQQPILSPRDQVSPFLAEVFQ